MKFFTASAAFALFAVLAHAAPNKARTVVVPVNFEGADPDAHYEKYIRADGIAEAIDNPLSVSWISGQDSEATCTFNGIDGSVTTVNGNERVPVGPPQVQISATCQL